MNIRHKNRLIKVALYFFYFIVAVFFLFPVLWVLSLSLKTVPELYKVPPAILPETFAWENYVYLFEQINIMQGIWNSLKVTAGTIVGTMIISVPAAYCFSRMKFRFSKQLQFIVLMFQMISPLVVVIPLYRYLSSLGMLNSLIGLTLIYIAISAPFQVWFLKSFLDTIPVELDEAATIDGCSRLQTVVKILLPVIVPGLFSGVLLVFITSWSQFIVPYILIDSPTKMPVSALLVNLQGKLNQITTHYLAGASVLTILPTVILFVFLQKYIVSALTSGAVKG
ncbi:Inner membrane ABC transporter permease protein ycjP [uncultured Ruminococcus sp.]|uniref:Carbohydrate ABC transporter permease n=1 Tax=Massiliimalia timonensis TaxID=1987501 RepID=A0A8J6NZ56_9FIRM|nr:carbohydrate ABC transporter permease [Massiliimalia timonensis]MBC8609981.1 carbohydrate ABC transporter permease [Massiliimalia timonensis]SCH16049.1 Inner membrane ABC transporter permease protein ycjP [uncultured Ruminococcus sp.]SCH22746.1 Inner membrane ABC transporter permease protein ycjP [uncultured Clostridium sp.]